MEVEVVEVVTGVHENRGGTEWRWRWWKGKVGRYISSSVLITIEERWREEGGEEGTLYGIERREWIEGKRGKEGGRKGGYKCDQIRY